MSVEYTHVQGKADALFEVWKEAFQPILETHDVLEVESEFSFDLLNPETESASKTFAEAGKIDGILIHRASGKRKVLEHKTTSDAITPESDYWHKLKIDTQPSKYILAQLAKEHDVSTVLYDVVQKPAQRPLQIPILDDEGFKIVLDASGNRLRTKDGKKWMEKGDSSLGYELQSREETPEEFRDRLIAVLRGDTQKYFSQREIPRSETDIKEYMQDAWNCGQQILYFRRYNIWPRNPDACNLFSKCEYFDLCCGRSAVDGIRFDRRPKKHAELNIAEDSREFLTNSRLRALRKCPRYHFLRYEEGVEPVGETSEALRLGTLFHAHVEEYLKTFIK